MCPDREKSRCLPPQTKERRSGFDIAPRLNFLLAFFGFHLGGTQLPVAMYPLPSDDQEQPKLCLRMTGTTY
jgi:hypothetical protein